MVEGLGIVDNSGMADTSLPRNRALFSLHPVIIRPENVLVDAEPIMRPQWWVNCGPMAAAATKAVRDGELRFTPPEAAATWFR